MRLPPLRPISKRARIRSFGEIGAPVLETLEHKRPTGDRSSPTVGDMPGSTVSRTVVGPPGHVVLDVHAEGISRGYYTPDAPGEQHVSRISGQAAQHRPDQGLAASRLRPRRRGTPRDDQADR